MAELAQLCARAAAASVHLVPVSPDPAFPLVLLDPAQHGFFLLSSAKAQDAGMPNTPLAQTIADTAQWDRDRGEPDLVSGPRPSQEAELLAGAQSEGSASPA